MRRIRSIVLAAFICMLSFSTCFAGEAESQAEAVDDSGATEIMPMYVNVNKLKVNFSISTDGTAKMNFILMLRAENLIDKIDVTFKISKIDGTVLYNRTFTVGWNAISNNYKLAKTFKLSKKGNYKMDATAKCYKDGKLIETVKYKTLKDSY